MQIIGLTGGIASGKTYAANIFKSLGATVIDADVIAREVVAKGTPALAEITAHFGDSILDTRQELNRDLLRDKIFADVTEKKWLENLLHPIIRKEIQHRLTKVITPYCLLVIPLLLETNYQDLVNRILVIDAPEQLQIDRACKRDNSQPEKIKQIMLTQASRSQRLALADDIIVNDGDLTKLTKQVEKLHEFYYSLSTGKE